MKIYKKFLNQCVIFKTDEFVDKRGFFTEIFNEKLIKKKINKNFKCKQINFIYSKKNSLRGLHFQKSPFSQMKILRVLKGKIFDVVVDIRKKSKTYGKYFSITLSDENKKQIFIPKGFAHGYMTVSKIAKVEYLCSNFYNKKYEGTIKWNDKRINIKWPKSTKYIVSKKDLLSGKDL
jgi:dTDP-4-dehydrorhamnose 3,5-epimerase